MMKPVNGVVHRFAHEAMGTIFEVMIAGTDEKYAGQASQAVFQEIDRLEALFSRFNACSEIGQINRLQPGESMRIGFETYDCLKTAALISAETDGAFDINFRSLIQGKAFAVFRTKSGFGINIQETPFQHTGRSVDLDLGAIGKGYALDRAQVILTDWGVERALIHGGTSTALAIGSAPGLDPGEVGWPVGVGGIWTLPGAPKRVLLRDRALSGSGTEVKGRHIQDPRTNNPAEKHFAAWVSHPRAAVADALSTAFMVMSQEDVRSYCQSHSEVWALLILDQRNHQIFNQEIFEQHI
jgi:thiamine biosynthesis lipoprotein